MVWQKLLLGIAIIVVSLVGFGANTYRFYLQRWDDAYITFRFADHLANSQGLVWNIGGERVEGFTSLLHVLLLAAGIRAGFDPWWSSLGLSVVCVLFGVAVVLTLIWKQSGTIHPVISILVGIYLIDPATAVHTTSGLETSFSLQSFSVHYSYRYPLSLHRDIPCHWASELLCFFRSLHGRKPSCMDSDCMSRLRSSCLTRTQPERIKENLLKVGSSIAFVAFLGVIYVTWKVDYFGYLLPNPFYVKSNKFSLAGLTEVREYILHLLKWLGPLILVIVLAFTLGGLGKCVDVRGMKNRLTEFMALLGHADFRNLMLAVLIPSLLALAFYTTIIHEVGGAYRFSYPTYLFFVLIVASVTASLTSRIKLTKGFERGLVIVALGCYGALFVSLKSWVGPPLPDTASSRYHLEIAKAVESTKLGTQGTILCDAAGIIPYVSGFNQVDRVGLVDNFLSGRRPATMAEREEYIWSRTLDVYLGSDPPATAGAIGFEDDPRMETRYVSESLLKRNLTLVEARIYPKDPVVLHARMRELRDNWHFVGEVEWPAWKSEKLKSFLYVRNDSPNASLLISRLEPLIKVHSDQVDFDNFETQ